MAKLKHKQIAYTVVPIAFGDSPYQARVGEFIAADTTLGAITVQSPVNPMAGDIFIVTKVIDTDPGRWVTITGTGGVMMQGRFDELQTSTVLIFFGDLVKYVYDGTQWLVESSEFDPYVEAWSVTPIATIPTTPTTITWTFSPLYTGQTPMMATHNAGVFTLNFDMRVDLNVTALWDYVLAGNNQDASSYFNDAYTGSGSIVFIPMANAFAHARLGTYQVSQNTFGRIAAIKGDTVRFDVNSNALDTGTTDLVDGILFMTAD